MMYRVTVEAVIRKTYEVEASSFQSAEEEAHALFNTNPEDEEYYRQQTIEVEEM